MMGDAVRRSALVFTVSEASRGRHPPLLPRDRPREGARRPERDRRGAAAGPRPGGDGARARALPAARPLRALRRQREAAQEPRAPDPRLRPGAGAGGQRGPASRPDRGRREPLRLAAPHRRGVRRAPGRALLRLRARTGPWPPSTAWRRSSPSRPSTRASASRRSRPWPAALRSSPRASRRSPRSWATALCSWTPTRRRRSRRGSPASSTTRSSAAALVERGLARAAKFSWERSVRSIHAGYMKALGRPVPATAEATS